MLGCYSVNGVFFEKIDVEDRFTADDCLQLSPCQEIENALRNDEAETFADSFSLLLEFIQSCFLD